MVRACVYDRNIACHRAVAFTNVVVLHLLFLYIPVYFCIFFFHFDFPNQMSAVSFDKDYHCFTKKSCFGNAK